MKVTIISSAGNTSQAAASETTALQRPPAPQKNASNETKPAEKRKAIAAENERSEKKTKLYESLDEPVTLIVGVEPNTRSFTVHKNILTQTSDFFKAACKPEWMKPEDRFIRFPDDDVEAIRVMVYWMYSDELCVQQKHLQTLGTYASSPQNAMESCWGLFAKLYVIGDKYGIPRLQNHCLDAILQSRPSDMPVICPAIIPYVYENTSSPDDALRRLLVTAFRCECASWSLPYFIRNTKPCLEFFLDVTAAFFGDKPEGTPLDYHVKLEQPDIDFCKKFHKHDEGIPPCDDLHKYHTISQIKKAKAADVSGKHMGAQASGSMEPVVID